MVEGEVAAAGLAFMALAADRPGGRALAFVLTAMVGAFMAFMAFMALGASGARPAGRCMTGAPGLPGMPIPWPG